MNFKIWKILILITVFIVTISCRTIVNLTFNKKLEADVCKHRWGLDASFTQTTDVYVTNGMAIAAEYYALKYNIPLTVFESKNRGSQLNDAFKMGRMDFGVYSNSCDSNLRKEPRKFILGYIKNVTNIRDGKRPSCISYGCGIDFYKNEIKELFLMGRNSLSTNDTIGFTYYGLDAGLPNDSLMSHLQLLSRPSTTRYFLMVKENQPQREETLRNHIHDAISTNGFYTDFSHWHASKLLRIPKKELSTLFKLMNESLDSANIYRGSFNDIAEYYYARQSVDEVKAVKNNNMIFVSAMISKKEDVDYSLISVPVSIKLNLSNTVLSKKDYISKKGGEIRKLNNGDLVIDLKLDFNEDASIVNDTLILTTNPKYLNLNVPKVTIEENKFISDQEIKVTIFRKLFEDDESKLKVYKRYFDFSKELKLIEEDKDLYEYYIGYINRTNNSGGINWN